MPPRNPKYPLEPLREHRDRIVDAATLQLGDAVRAREAADEAKVRAERERLVAEARAEGVRRTEAERLGKGELCVADLARAQAWELAASAEAAALVRTVDQAADSLVIAHGAEVQARAELAQKKADLDVVARDEARFDAGARRAHEAAEEEEAAEVFTATARRRDE